VQETLEGLQQAAATAGQAPKGGAGVQANDREGHRGVQSVDRYMPVACRLLRVVCCMSSVAWCTTAVTMPAGREAYEEDADHARVCERRSGLWYHPVPYSTLQYARVSDALDARAEGVAAAA
jgi:hypothetical protein